MLTLASRGGGPPPDPANRGPGLRRTAKLLALESVKIFRDKPRVCVPIARGCAITAVTAATAFTAQATHAAAEETDQDQDIRRLLLARPSSLQGNYLSSTAA